MLKAFLLVFNDAQISRQDLLDYLDTCPEVKNWYAFMPTAIFIVSDSSAFNLAEKIRSARPGKNFVITEVPQGGNDGWIAQKAWDFINSPTSSGRWPA